MNNEEYLTMKEIGAMLGSTSHKVGRTLKDMGYRTSEGRPSKKAFSSDMVTRRWSRERAEVYNWVWHKARTLAVLAQAGFVMKE